MKTRQFLLVGILLLAAALEGKAQSQDRDNPTPLTSNPIQGSGVGKKVEYYYGFSAGPGELIITVDLKAKSGSTSGEVEIFDEEANKIFYYYPNATSQNERAVKKVTLSNKQALTLRLALDNSAGVYSLKLAGPIELAAATPAVDPATSSSTGEQTQPTTDVPPPDPAASATPEVAVGTKAKGSKFDFGVNLLQTVGTQFGLPTSGVLHIVMKDGTTQDIDLSKVKTASIAKQ